MAWMPRLLLVDDEAMVRETLAPVLEQKLHWDVVTASNGAEALDELARETYDVVLADFEMPGMDGVTLLREVGRLQPQARRVLMAQRARASVRQAAAQVAAVDALVNKPYSLRQLQRTLAAVVARPRTRVGPPS